MSSESTINENVFPETWDAKLILAFLDNPAFDEFSQWVDAELATLEANWRHASSPTAWLGSGRRASRQATV
jgi:hypothetical protein